MLVLLTEPFISVINISKSFIRKLRKTSACRSQATGLNWTLSSFRWIGPLSRNERMKRSFSDRLSLSIWSHMYFTPFNITLSISVKYSKWWWLNSTRIILKQNEMALAEVMPRHETMARYTLLEFSGLLFQYSIWQLFCSPFPFCLRFSTDKSTVQLLWRRKFEPLRLDCTFGISQSLSDTHIPRIVTLFGMTKTQLERQTNDLRIDLTHR